MIGILDSGLGGLSVYLPLRRCCQTDILYLADEAHLPYGEKTESELFSYATAALDFFERMQADAVIFACTTLSCTVLPRLHHTPMPVFGTAEPAIAAAICATVNRRVAVCATKATVASQYLQRRLREQGAEVLALPTAPLVSLVENGQIGKEADQTVQRLLAPAAEFGADTVLLGCTHYGFLKDSIRRALPTAAQIDCGEKAAKALQRSPLLAKESAKTAFYTTQNEKDFARKLKTYLPDTPCRIAEIHL